MRDRRAEALALFDISVTVLEHLKCQVESPKHLHQLRL